MAASLDGIFSESLQKSVNEAKILVVGAGGIGCELLKNLALTGFKDIEIIDLDTIDVSNLNRQFLFHKQHVGKSKAAVAAESVMQFNPDLKIRYYHDSIIKGVYDAAFFSRFTVILNALDNLNARYHVNRMCLASNVPLIESGTSGYLGQVELIKKGITGCYECCQRRRPKDIASCTIRNTPSEPIHCIVWAKHLFNQLFGVADEEDISPDMMDPELAKAPTSIGKENECRISTRKWVQQIDYDPWQLFEKIFNEDIKLLLLMSVLWDNRARKKPTPLNSKTLPDSVPGSSKEVTPSLKDMALWSIKECADVFARTIKALKKRMDENDGAALVWDKDDDEALDFVVASSNIRAYIFQIQQKSRWEIKSIAGNIIPAIATTNAVIAGVVVLKTLSLLQEQLDRCTSVYLCREFSNGKLLADEKYLTSPNPQCIACRADPAAVLFCNTNTFKVKDLEEEIFKKALFFVAPDVRVKSTYFYIISSEEGETEQNNEKTLKEMNVNCGETLQGDDYLQNYSIDLKIKHYEAKQGDPEFMLSTTGVDLTPQMLNTNQQQETDEKQVEDHTTDDDLMIIEPHALKRKLDDTDFETLPVKKRFIEDDCTVID